MNATILRKCAPSLLTLALAAQADDDLDRKVAEWRAVREADAVVAARVVRVHPSPGIWCGKAMVEQVVTWRVERAVDGQAPTGDVEVGHLVLIGSPLVAERAPHLRPDLLYPGARALLCLRRDPDGGLHALAAGVALAAKPRRADPAHAAMLAAVFSMPELRPYWHLEQRGQVPRCRLDDVVPVPFDARVADRPVEFLPPELLGEGRHLRVRSLRRDGDRGRVEFEIAAEGVVGFAVLARDDGAWRVVEREVAER